MTKSTSFFYKSLWGINKFQVIIPVEKMIGV